MPNHPRRHIMTRNISLLSVFHFFFMLPLWLNGQGYNERVTIVGAYQPSLKDAQKISMSPLEQNLQSEIGEQQYSNLSILHQAQVSLTPIAYAPERDEKKKELFNYLDAALGTNLSPIFNFRHRSAFSKNTVFDLGIGHWSSWVNIKDMAHSNRMHNQIGAGITHSFSKYSWQNDIDFSHDFLHYYGFKPDDFPETPIQTDMLLQTYQRLALNSNLIGLNTAKDALKHNIRLHFSHFSDRFQNKEQQIELTGNLAKQFEWFGNNSSQKLGLDTQITLFSADDSLAAWRGIYTRIAPSISFSGSFFELKAALNGTFGDDTTSFANLHPQLLGKLFVFDDKLQFYAGFGGNKQLHTLELNTLEIPFLKPGENRWWSNTTHDFKTGIRTSLIQNLDFNIGLQYQQIENGGFVVTDTLSRFQHQLGIIRDNYTQLSFIAEAAFHLGETLHAVLSFSSDQYQPEKLPKAWHKPAWNTKLDLRYRYNEQWSFNSKLFLIGKRYAPTGNTYKSLPTAFDINLKASYQINKSLGIYAQLANLLNKHYEIWTNYPVQGAQLFAGATLKF